MHVIFDNYLIKQSSNYSYLICWCCSIAAAASVELNHKRWSVNATITCSAHHGMGRKQAFMPARDGGPPPRASAWRPVMIILMLAAVSSSRRHPVVTVIAMVAVTVYPCCDSSLQSPLTCVRGRAGNLEMWFEVQVRSRRIKVDPLGASVDSWHWHVLTRVSYLLSTVTSVNLDMTRNKEYCVPQCCAI